VSALDLIVNNQLSFQAPCYEKFPCLRLAFEALEAKGTAPAILNAANEVAVDAFLCKKIGFLAIPELIEKTITSSDVRAADSIATILSVDRDTRELTSQLLAEFL
jgi:1-deoxy-D-xylulose-5-phosphate reductoisomerase